MEAESRVTNGKDHSHVEVCELNRTKQKSKDDQIYLEHGKNSNSGSVTWKDVRYQIWATNVGFLFTANDGMTLAFSNLVLDLLSHSTGSWFASIVGLSIPIGSLLSGPLMDRYGRKTTNVLLAIPCIPAWFLTCSLDLDSQFWLYLTRFLAGLAMGLATSNIVYASEISHKKYRPFFLSLATFYFGFGILLVSILQIFLTWRQVAFFNGVFFIIALFLNFFFTPETPIWLARFRGDWTEAKRSLKWLNPNPEVFEEEWKELSDTLKLPHEQNRKNTFQLSSPSIYKPLYILFVLFTLQQASLVYTLIVYTVTVLPRISSQRGKLIGNEAFALLGALRFLANIISCYLSMKVGRRPLLLYSCLGMILMSILLAILPYRLDIDYKSTVYEIYECSLIMMYFMIIVFGTLGVMTVPWSLMVELFPHEVRSVGSAVMICYSYSLLFIFAKIFPFALDIFGTSCIFAFIAVVSVIMGSFVVFYIPETLNKTFAEIEKYFQE